MIVSIKAFLLVTLCVYHEARGENIEGQKAVVHIILNRTVQREQSVEKVIYDRWQFSWTMDDIPDYPTDLLAFLKCAQAVEQALRDREQGYTLKQANHYFNPEKVLPSWADGMKKVASIGNHDFYKG